MEAWVNAILSWLPFLLLIAFWIYFMKRVKFSRQQELIELSFQHYARVEALLERIAVAMERGERAS